jgi:hypothetical protein
MNVDKKINGLYDSRTIKRLKELGCSKFCFDFRVRSFNFLQQHQFLSILDDVYSTSDEITLRYENEADFVIQKMVDDLKEVEKINTKHNIVLEFSDDLGPDFYDQFETPYYWHYSKGVKLSKIKKAKFLKGIIIPFSILEEAHEDDQYYNFVNNFHSMFVSPERENKLDIGLDIDWTSNLLPSLTEFFDFSFLSISINDKVESCFRNVNLDKLSTSYGRISL